jgi:hypothetical protein
MPSPAAFAQAIVAEAHELAARFAFDFTRARILREFRQAGATHPRRAQPYHPRTAAERKAFTALRLDGVVATVRSGYFYVQT